MYVVIDEKYYKVTKRKDGSQFFVRKGKRVNVDETHTLVARKSKKSKKASRKSRKSR